MVWLNSFALVVDIPIAPEEIISWISCCVLIKPPAMTGTELLDLILSIILGRIRHVKILKLLMILM